MAIAYEFSENFPELAKNSRTLATGTFFFIVFISRVKLKRERRDLKPTWEYGFVVPERAVDCLRLELGVLPRSRAAERLIAELGFGSSLQRRMIFFRLAVSYLVFKSFLFSNISRCECATVWILTSGWVVGISSSDIACCPIRLY